MNNKKIIVDIDQTGNISIDGEGFVGPECHNLIKEIGDAIGQTTRSEKKKEYNIKTIIKQKERN
jgi:hypothetical protein